MRFVVTVWRELISLLVDDGFLAIASLVAIGFVWIITTTDLIDATNFVGWLLFLLLAISVVVSSKRGVRNRGEK